MKKRALPLGSVYGLLEPGPVVLVSTACGAETDIMAMSWHMMVDFEPPLIACILSNRNHSFELLRKSRECVINIPAMELADQVVRCGNSSGTDVDKFAGFGLTPKPASQVKAPLIDECYANIECRIADGRMVNRYNLFILEGLAAWIETPRRDWHTIHHLGLGSFMVSGETIRLRSRMR